MSSAVIFEADACGEMGDMPMGCCHDEVDYFELQDDYQTTQISIDITPSFEITHFNYKEVSINLYAPFNKNISFVDPPSPPLIHGDTYKWVQSYLI